MWITWKYDTNEDLGSMSMMNSNIKDKNVTIETLRYKLREMSKERDQLELPHQWIIQIHRCNRLQNKYWNLPTEQIWKRTCDIVVSVRIVGGQSGQSFGHLVELKLRIDAV